MFRRLFKSSKEAKAQTATEASSPLTLDSPRSIDGTWDPRALHTPRASSANLAAGLGSPRGPIKHTSPYSLNIFSISGRFHSKPPHGVYVSFLTGPTVWLSTNASQINGLDCLFSNERCELPIMHPSQEIVVRLVTLRGESGQDIVGHGILRGLGSSGCPELGGELVIKVTIRQPHKPGSSAVAELTLKLFFAAPSGFQVAVFDADNESTASSVSPTALSRCHEAAALRKPLEATLGAEEAGSSTPAHREKLLLAAAEALVRLGDVGSNVRQSLEFLVELVRNDQLHSDDFFNWIEDLFWDMSELVSEQRGTRDFCAVYGRPLRYPRAGLLPPPSDGGPRVDGKPFTFEVTHGAESLTLRAESAVDYVRWTGCIAAFCRTSDRGAPTYARVGAAEDAEGPGGEAGVVLSGWLLRKKAHKSVLSRTSWVHRHFVLRASSDWAFLEWTHADSDRDVAKMKLGSETTVTFLNRESAETPTAWLAMLHVTDIISKSDTKFDKSNWRIESNLGALCDNEMGDIACFVVPTNGAEVRAEVPMFATQDARVNLTLRRRKRPGGPESVAGHANVLLGRLLLGPLEQRPQLHVKVDGSPEDLKMVVELEVDPPSSLILRLFYNPSPAIKP